MDKVSGVERRPDGSVRIRPTGRARVAEAAPLLVIPALITVPTDMPLGFWAVYAAMAAFGDQLTRRRGVTLCPDEAVVHLTFRRRRIPWSEIQAVTVEGELSRTVLLWTAERERVRLGAPTGAFRNKRFDAAHAVIGQYWLAHRGADWAPLWPLPAPTPSAPQSVPPPGFDPFAPRAS